MIFSIREATFTSILWCNPFRLNHLMEFYPVEIRHYVSLYHSQWQIDFHKQLHSDLFARCLFMAIGNSTRHISTLSPHSWFTGVYRFQESNPSMAAYWAGDNCQQDLSLGDRKSRRFLLPSPRLIVQESGTPQGDRWAEARICIVMTKYCRLSRWETLVPLGDSCCSFRFVRINIDEIEDQGIWWD
jgi:hypothetical protein